MALRTLILAAATVALTSADCPKDRGLKQKAVKHLSDECPPLTNIEQCDEELKYQKAPNGDCCTYCQGNGECKTDDDLDNCKDSSDPGATNPYADIYKVECDPSQCDGGSGGGGGSGNKDKDFFKKCINAEGNIDVLFAGDSITYGRRGKDSDPSGTLNTYPDKACYQLHQDGHDKVVCHNLGVSGATAQHVGYNPWKSAGKWPKLEEKIKTAGAMVFMLGTNDAKIKDDPPKDSWPAGYAGKYGNWCGDDKTKCGERYVEEYAKLIKSVMKMAPPCTQFFIGLSIPQMCHAPVGDGKKDVPDYDGHGSGYEKPKTPRPLVENRDVRGMYGEGCTSDDILRDWGLDSSIINLDLPIKQKEVYQKLIDDEEVVHDVTLIDFRADLGDVIGKDGVFQYLAPYSYGIRIDAVHPEGGGNLAMGKHAAKAIEAQEAAAGFKNFAEVSLPFEGGDVIAVKVPTLDRKSVV